MARAQPSPPNLPGYTFIRLLGSGGFSDVFLYEQHLPKRRVAVKVLLTDELTEANRAAFVAEANLMAQLSAHPYIVSIFHADVAADRPYFVMEYCSGPSFSDRYKRERLSVVDVLRTGIRVASAVATAHAAGILHRDIKPANILTNDFGWPALTDFGISSALDDDAHSVPSGVGTTPDTDATASVGMSVPWSPPEMFEDNPKPDARADVFSLAATLFTLLAGHTPFEVRGRPNGALDLIGRIERGLVTPLERPDVPRSLVAVLQKGMATRTEDRFASAVDFARALQRVELELGYSPTAIDVPNMLVEQPTRDSTAEDDDATRARGVATIEAQPSSPAAADDATLVRGAQRVAAQPRLDDAPAETIVRPRVTAPPTANEQLTPDAPPADEDADRPSRANRVALWVSAALIVLIGAGVGIGLVVSGVPSPVEQTAKPSPSGSSAIVTNTVPTPELVSVTPGAGTLDFVVSHPDAEDGDTYIWRRTDRGAAEPTRRASDGHFSVEGFDGGAVCVEVRVVRSGRDSANPLEGCFPDPSQ